ncbi:hypothetical protein HID58_094191 [Brassica napus]|uniref:Uncharacterized protein n=1 Tax=Brassica napus TaxID=3708 RepID=A0ABQ7X8B8_BRANA|nr:hypothetical protein HID58_094191 [Brassica napus]
MNCTLKLKRIRCLRIRFSSGENARSVKASAGRSSEGVEKTDSTGGGGARQFDGLSCETFTAREGY